MMNDLQKRGIAKSWMQPKVRQARSSRHAVIANGVAYSSCNQAFKQLGLDKKRLIPVRKILKIKKNILIVDNATGRTYNFICVPYSQYQYQTQKQGKAQCSLIGRKPAQFEFDITEAWVIAKTLSQTE